MGENSLPCSPELLPQAGGHPVFKFRDRERSLEQALDSAADRPKQCPEGL